MKIIIILLIITIPAILYCQDSDRIQKEVWWSESAPPLDAQQQKNQTIDIISSEEKTEPKPMLKLKAEKKAPVHSFIICISAEKTEQLAKKSLENLNINGIEGGYLWIPDIQHGGKQLYRVYAGPLPTKSEADHLLKKISELFPDAYISKL